MVVFASEDVRRRWWWLWRPPMHSPWSAYPKLHYNLSEAAIYLATATKSNSVARAIGQAP